MAIITCPNCGKKISDIGNKCTACGYDLTKYIKNEDLAIRNEILKSFEISLDEKYKFLKIDGFDYNNKDGLNVKLLDKDFKLSYKTRNALKIVKVFETNLKTEVVDTVRHEYNIGFVHQINRSSDLKRFMDKIIDDYRLCCGDVIKYLFDIVSYPEKGFTPIIELSLDCLNILKEELDKTLEKHYATCQKAVDDHNRNIDDIESSELRGGAKGAGLALGGMPVTGIIGMNLSSTIAESRAMQEQDLMKVRINDSSDINAKIMYDSFCNIINNYLTNVVELVLGNTDKFDKTILKPADFLKQPYRLDNIIKEYAGLKDNKDELLKLINYYELGKDYENYLSERLKIKVIEYYKEHNDDKYTSDELELLTLINGKSGKIIVDDIINNYNYNKYSLEENEAYQLKGNDKIEAFNKLADKIKEEKFLSDKQRKIFNGNINNAVSVTKKKMDKKRKKILIVSGVILAIFLIIFSSKIIKAIKVNNALNFYNKTWYCDHDKAYVHLTHDKMEVAYGREDNYYEKYTFSCHSLDYSRKSDYWIHEDLICTDQNNTSGTFFISKYVNEDTISVSKSGDYGFVSGTYGPTSMKISDLLDFDKAPLNYCDDRGVLCDNVIDKTKFSGKYINEDYNKVLFLTEDEFSVVVLDDKFNSLTQKDRIRNIFKDNNYYKCKYCGKLSDSGEMIREGEFYVVQALTTRYGYNTYISFNDGVVTIAAENNKSDRYLGVYHKYDEFDIKEDN